MAGNFPEILAPVGGREQLEAAVRCGADAVYLGAKSFNARQNATNFEYDEFSDAVDYCHVRGVKVYLVLNTLISDAELEAALEQAMLATRAGVDAIIIQDIGLAAEIRKRSDIPLHASTQMSVGTLEGIKILHSLGFKRAVLPRELSFSEIEYIAKNSPIELECFVHGALCMCVSGQCLLSAVLGSRSGNRGLCAQPCRLPFSSRGDGGCHLSLKDLSLVSELKRLRDIGITSFKIEGRMKRAEYVACAVTACRQALHSTLSPEIENSLRSVFSRSGFTKGHFEGRRDGDMFGIRRKEDVVSASSVLRELERL
ncbi:MAG: U32 family peptidase, partial [Clostridia bacterium]|nr:U32 family peptidase [Clostridia bacterium]